MDALSQLVDLLAPHGRMDLRCLFGKKWEAPHQRVGPWIAPFHIVLRGECELRLPESNDLQILKKGSLTILPRGAAHILCSAAGQTGGGAVRLYPGEIVDTKTNLAPSEPADVEILCGEFEFGGRRRSALLDALPEHISIQFDAAAEFIWLESLVRLMAHEIEQNRPGAAAIVADLCSVLFTQAVRAQLDTRMECGGVLGLMRSSRMAPALQAMLEQPEHDWTVASLALLSNHSRATFAREFKRLSGTSPLQLLTCLRMELASRLLTQSQQDTAAIGEAVGYLSEAAFNRAFTSYAGITPARFRSSSSVALETASRAT